MNNGRTSVLQNRVIRQQRMNRNFSGNTNIAGLLIAVCPFGNIQQPFRRTQILKHVRELQRTYVQYSGEQKNLTHSKIKLNITYE